MEKIEITVQERKGKLTVTWIDGVDNLPQNVREKLLIGIANAFE